jgi:hypothetical protein
MSDQTRYEIDRGAIGTCAYRGLAYFWAHEYRYELRSITSDSYEISDRKYDRILTKMRRRVHADLLGFGLPLGGVSDRHRQIVDYHSAKARLELEQEEDR